MRIFHCTVALALVAGAAAAQPAPPPSNSARFTVFLGGVPAGTEEVLVVRSAQGVTISGTSRVGPPLNISIRRAEIRYTADLRPVECTIEGSLNDQLLAVHTVVTGTSAVTDATQGLQTGRKTDQISADAVLLPNAFFGAYEGLALRLAGLKPSDEVRAYLPAGAELTVRVNAVAPETIRTPIGTVRVTRFEVRILTPDQPIDAELWVASDGRLVRLALPAQRLDYARNDVVSVASRREPVAHAGDEPIRMAANGFYLAGTLTRPAGTTRKGTRLPAILLVAGAGQADRDETVAGVPVLGQLASALADAGFIAVRYDRRGIGQSGGRVESVGLRDYAEDLRAAVKALRKRKDVDPKRLAVVGYGDGGAVALDAARRDDGIRALVLLNAPGTSGAEVVLEQQRHALSLLSIPEAEKQAKIALQKKINDAVLTGRGWEGVPAAVRRQAETPWFQSYLAFDPAQVLPKVRLPIQIVVGSLDREVDPANGRKLEALARARKSRKGQTVEFVEIPGVNHLFAPATTGEMDEYDRLPARSVSDRVPAAIAGWLRSVWAAVK